MNFYSLQDDPSSISLLDRPSVESCRYLVYVSRERVSITPSIGRREPTSCPLEGARGMGAQPPQEGGWMARYPWPVTELARALPAVTSKAMGGPRHELQGASILRGSGRTRCHWTPDAEPQGHDGLLDGRTQRPGPRHGPLSIVEQGVWLY